MGRCAPPMPWAEPESHLESTQARSTPPAHVFNGLSIQCAQWNLPLHIFAGSHKFSYIGVLT